MTSHQDSVATSLPDLETIKKAAQLEILDKSGNKVKFGSVFEDQKTVVVFIRHFFCGSCQAYVERLASIPKEALENGHVKIAVIGCGGWEAVQAYIDITEFQGSIYADPSRSLYHALGMTIENLKTTPDDQQRRSYLTKGIIQTTMESFWKGPIKNASLIGKQGNLSQLGGDFIFGPGLQCTFASRMQHTEDHIEIVDLFKGAGVNAL